MSNVSGWLPNLLGPHTIKIAGVEHTPTRSTWNFTGITATDDAVNERTDFAITDGASPLAFTGTGAQNDVVSTNASGKTVTALRCSGVAPTLNGIASGTDGRRLIVRATGGPVVLANENGGSVAANRIVTGTGASVTIANGSGALIEYDGTSSRWRLIGDGAGGSGTTPTGTGLRKIVVNVEDAVASLLVNADVAAAAAIAGSKVQPNFVAQQVQTTGPIIGGSIVSDATIIASSSLAAYTFGAFGAAASVATIGSVRLVNNEFVYGRDAANAANVKVIGVNASDAVAIGGAAVVLDTASSMSATANARARLYSNIANVQTTDATVTSLYTWTILDEAVTLATFEGGGCLSTGADTAAYVRRIKFKRDGGTVTAGTVETTFTDESVGTWDCTIDNSTSTGRVRVTGVGATTIDWGGVLSRCEVSHA